MTGMRWIEVSSSIRRLGFGFDLKVFFNRFLTSTDQLEMKGILLNTKNGDNSPFDLKWSQARIKPNHNGGNKLECKVSIPSEKHAFFTGDTEFILAIRLKLENEASNYFPYPLRSIPVRYMAAKIPFIFSEGSYSDDEVESKNLRKIDNLAFDSLENLKRK